MGIAVGSVFALLFRVTSLFFWGIIGIITARTLSVDDRGVYASTVIVIAVVGGILSVSSAASYLVANQRRDEGEIAWHGAILSLVLGAFVLAIAVALMPIVPSDLQAVTLLAGLAIIPSILRNTLNGILLGSNQLHRYNLSVNASPGIGLALIACWVGLLHHHSIEAALGAWMIAQYASLLPVLIWGHTWWRWPTRRRLNRTVTRRLLGFGAVTGAASVIGFLNYRVDVLMVIALDSREGAGIYSSSVALAEALWLFSSAISVASYSRVGSTTRQEAARLTAAGVRHTLLVVVGGGLFAAVLAPLLLGTLFGDVYRAGSSPLRILCIGTAAFAPTSLLGNYFTVQMGKPAIALWLAALSCAISVIAGFALIPAFGANGAAWSTTISYSVAAVISVIVFLKSSRTPASELWRVRRSDVLDYWRLVRRLAGMRSAPAGAELASS